MLDDGRTRAIPAAGSEGTAAAAGDGGAMTRGPAASAYRDWFTWLLAAAAFGAYTVMSLFRLLTLTTMSWDLGIYTEYVKQLASLRAPVVNIRGPGFNLLGDHFQVIVGLLAPFFRLFPSPATLLVGQALLTAVSVFPVVQAGFALLGPGRGRARAIGVAYGFSWGLQQMINFDFHEIAFAVPLLAFSLSALVRGKYRAAVIWALPLVFVKEDQGFTVAAIGLYLAIAGWRAADRRRIAGGAFLAAWGAGWSLLAIMVIIPHFNPQHVYYYWTDGGVIGGGRAFSLPGLLRQTAYAWPVKLQTSVLLLLPTAFIALGSPLALVTLPSIGLRFVATNPNYWGTDWHYNATVMPILFIAAIEAMGRWSAAGAGAAARDRVKAAAVRSGAAMMAAIAVAMAFQFPLSDLWHGTTYTITAHVAADNAAMARVPDGATVTATLSLLAPLGARTDTYWIGNSGNPLTQYIVFDGRDSGYEPPPASVPQFIEQQLYRGDGYRQVFQDDGVYVFERG
jgi:uncharacterized membrane protein